MKNFEYDGKKYWYSRSVAVMAIITGFIGNKMLVLANRRGKNTPDFRRYWNMPCGYVDFNETTEQAIQREVKEETGLIIPIKKLFIKY